jgi:hypothetical protein
MAIIKNENMIRPSNKFIPFEDDPEHEEWVKKLEQKKNA